MTTQPPATGIARGVQPGWLQSEEPLTVVRGVRDGTDLEAELRFARILQDLRPATRVVWIGCDANLQHVSSSACRELEGILPGASARYVPEAKEIYGLCG